MNGLELLFAGLIGVAIGTAAILVAKPREAAGIALLPSLGAITALVYWVVASWAMRLFGWEWLRYDAVGIWTILVAIVASVTITTALTLPRRRAEDDEDLFERLSHRGAVS